VSWPVPAGGMEYSTSHCAGSGFEQLLQRPWNVKSDGDQGDCGEAIKPP
jgi:hypothetical protein